MAGDEGAGFKGTTLRGALPGTAREGRTLQEAVFNVGCAEAMTLLRNLKGRGLVRGMG